MKTESATAAEWASLQGLTKRNCFMIFNNLIGEIAHTNIQTVVTVYSFNSPVLHLIPPGLLA